MTLLEKLRLGFLARSRREKLLSVAFLVVLTALWLVLFVDRWRRFAPELAQVRSDAEENSRWLAAEPNIASRYQAALEVLRDTSLKGPQAYATIDQISRGSGLGFRMDPPSSNRREQLTFYPINVNITKGDYNQLRKYYQDVLGALPSVKLDEVTIAAPGRAVPGQPVLLDAKFKFVAIEINQ
jgi:hypothetical protein